MRLITFRKTSRDSLRAKKLALWDRYLKSGDEVELEVVEGLGTLTNFIVAPGT